MDIFEILCLDCGHEFRQHTRLMDWECDVLVCNCEHFHSPKLVAFTQEEYELWKQLGEQMARMYAHPA